MTLLQQQIRFQTQITHRFNKWDRKRREREREVLVFEKRESMSRLEGCYILRGDVSFGFGTWKFVNVSFFW